MRIIPFITSLTDKLTPMNPTDKIQLVNEAVNDYNEQLIDVQKYDGIQKKRKANIELTKEELTYKPSLKVKILYYLEMWQCRFVLAILFPVVLKWLTDYLYSKEDNMDQYEDD